LIFVCVTYRIQSGLPKLEANRCYPIWPLDAGSWRLGVILQYGRVSCRQPRLARHHPSAAPV
jgi:hypothetical protein